jgi:hypothetical protein
MPRKRKRKLDESIEDLCTTSILWRIIASWGRAGLKYWEPPSFSGRSIILITMIHGFSSAKETTARNQAESENNQVVNRVGWDFPLALGKPRLDPAVREQMQG